MSLKSNAIRLYRELESMRVIGRFISWIVYAKPRDRRDEAAMAERRALWKGHYRTGLRLWKTSCRGYSTSSRAARPSSSASGSRTKNSRKKAGKERALL